LKEPLDSILSGGGEAVSGQTTQTTGAETSRAGEGDSHVAQGHDDFDAQTSDADAAEAHRDDTRMVPHQALHAERQKVRRYTEEVADFRKALAETNAAFERRMGQLVEAIVPRQGPPPPPDFFDNPEAATRHSVVETVSPEFERINQTLHAFARDQAIGRFEEARVNDAEQAFLGALRAGQLDPADYRRVVGSANRYAEAVRWHQRQTARAEIGDDPAAYRSRLEAELREQILAELGSGGAQRFAQLAPSNLAGARNVGARGGPAWSGPASLNDIFDRGRK
jgi:hypothetical protein